VTAQRVCGVSELEQDTPLRVEPDGVPITVIKDGEGVIHAIGDTCTHGDISLAEGFVEDDTLECWAHGSKFGLADGAPRNFPAFEPVPVYTVDIDGSDIYVDTTTRK
jgi:3-phenylpropionate/trans-cinnamate dioxygenase ferredoxin subunit